MHSSTYLGLSTALALGIVGCRHVDHVDVTAKIVEVTPDAVTLEVKTKPGMHVGIGTTIHEGESVVTDASGTARVKLPRKKWQYYSGWNIQIAAEKKRLVFETYGNCDVKLPVNVKSLMRIPTEADKAGVALLGGTLVNESGGESDVFESGEGDDRLMIFVGKKAKTIPLVLSAAKEAKLQVAGKAVEVSETGLTETEITKEDFALFASTKYLLGNQMRATIPIAAKTSEANLTTTIELAGPSSAVLPLLAKRVAGVETGEKFPSFPVLPTVDAVVIAREDGDVHWVGPHATAVQAKWVAVEHGTTRDGGSCSYGMSYTAFSLRLKYLDIELKIYDAHAGTKVATKKFMTPTLGCPGVASSGDSLVYRPKTEDVEEWLEKQRKSDFK